jgi:hypothetical protein
MPAFNALIIGVVAMAVSSGPYSSRQQELWYRYGSLALLTGGAVLPALALLFGAYRSRQLTGALVAWSMSGGGAW